MMAILTTLSFLALGPFVSATPSSLYFTSRPIHTKLSAGIFPSRSLPSRHLSRVSSLPSSPLPSLLGARCGATPGSHLSAGSASTPSASASTSTSPSPPADWNGGTTDDETDVDRDHWDGIASDDRSASYAKRLKSRNSMHMRRKITHAAFGVTFALARRLAGRKRFLIGGTFLTLATLFIEMFRYRRGFGWMNDILHLICGGILRKHEMNGKFTGGFYYFFGCTMTAYLFPGNEAILGMIQLAFADPSASYFGKKTRHVYWSRIEDGLGGIGRNKGVLGFLGGALFCVPFNYEILSVASWPSGVPSVATRLLVSVLLGTAGAFSDLAVPTPAVTMPSRICGIRVPPFHIDDNFVVPIASAYGATKIFQRLDIARDLRLAEFLFFRI